MKDKLRFYAYVDGAVSHNGKPNAKASAAAILMAINEKGVIVKEKECVWDVDGKQDISRAELSAVVNALAELTRRCQIFIVTDSAYVIRGSMRNIRKHIGHFNEDLWERLWQFQHQHTIRFIKTKAHADNEYHNRVDELARKAARKAIKHE